MTVWENQSNVENLIKFRELVINYFNNAKTPEFGFDLIEDEKTQQIRNEINLILDKSYKSIIQAGIIPKIYYTPPRITGGFQGDIDIMLSIFNLNRLKINPALVVDMINRSIGIYEDDKRKATIRSFNPLFYISLLLEFLADFPFKILGEIGFNSKKIEASFIGKILKTIIYIIEFAAAFLTMLQLLGYLDQFKSMFIK